MNSTGRSGSYLRFLVPGIRNTRARSLASSSLLTKSTQRACSALASLRSASLVRAVEQVFNPRPHQLRERRITRNQVEFQCSVAPAHEHCHARSAALCTEIEPGRLEGLLTLACDQIASSGGGPQGPLLSG